MTPLLSTLMLCVFAVTTGEFIIAGILPQVAADLNVSVPAAGLLVTAYAVGMIFGGPILTALTAHIARKPLVIALVIVAIIGNIASALAPDYTSLMFARVLTALVTSTFFANAIVIATSNVAANKKASTVAKLAFGMNIAMILGVPLGTWASSLVGWRIVFFAIAMLCVCGALLAWRYVPRTAGSPGKASAFTELKVLKNRAVMLAMAITVFGNAGVLAVFTFFAPLLTEVADYQPETVASLLLLYGVGATVGNLAGGWLADKALKQSQVGLLGALIICLGSMWIVGSNMMVMPLMIFLLGALSFSVIPGMQTRVLIAAASAPTLAIAVNASAYQLAAAFAGWYGGRVIEAINLQAIYAVAAIITCFGLLLSVYSYLSERDNGQVIR